LCDAQRRGICAGILSTDIGNWVPVLYVAHLSRHSPLMSE